MAQGSGTPEQKCQRRIVGVISEPKLATGKMTESVLGLTTCGIDPDELSHPIKPKVPISAKFFYNECFGKLEFGGHVRRG